jgi:hypothetical protein
MLSDHGGVDVRHGTDFFEFDGSETIQPELLNMVRWVLSWLGGDCCSGEYDTCAETDDRCDVFHHNPRFRGGDDGLCCVPMPIKFRWSGSNVHPHYLTGGKGLVGGPTPDPRPLHNHPNHVPGQGEVWGSEAARKSWRGTNMLYADAPFDNPFYGGGYSWGTAPGTFTLMYEPLYDPVARVYARYPSWGLRPGDVIEAVHIQEIIAAVDYLIDYGVWTSIAVCTRRRTPGSFMGQGCGRHYSRVTWTQDGGGSYENESWNECGKCCVNWDTCAYEPCVPFTAPTWGDCWNDCRHDVCGMVAEKQGECWYLHREPPEEDSSGTSYQIDVSCDGAQVLGCGAHGNCVGCWVQDWEGNWQPYYFTHTRCRRRVEGASYYVCTPPACHAGWDDSHGGQFKKNRRDHDWHAGEGLYLVATGPPGFEFSGNCLGDMYGCGQTYPVGPDQGLWFHEVTGVHWSGLAVGWYAGCSAAPGCDGSTECGAAAQQAAQGLPAGIPGYGLHAADGDPLCQVCHHKRGGCGINCGGSDPNSPTTDGHFCQCSLGDFPVCRGEAVWVAVDLNLDGSGRPYRSFPGRNGGLPPYEGRGVPRLRDYDLTRDPATWMHDCPCETWTGAGVCEIT